MAKSTKCKNIFASDDDDDDDDANGKIIIS